MAMRHPKSIVLSGALCALIVMTVSYLFSCLFFIHGMYFFCASAFSNCCSDAPMHVCDAMIILVCHKFSVFQKL